jgi:hypothetical protein
VSSAARTVSRTPLAEVASRHGVTAPPRVLVGPVACGDEAREPGAARVRDVWPDAVAVQQELIGSVRLLEEMRERGRFTQFTALWSLPGSADPGHAALAAAVVLTRLVAEAWPRPPVGDEPDRSEDGPGPGPA